MSGKRIIVDYFSSTARGLFLAPGDLASGAQEIPLFENPVPPNASVAVEVVEKREGSEIDRLEVIQPVPGSRNAWNVSDVPLSPGMRLVVAFGGRYANRSISGRPPAGLTPVGAEVDLLNVGGVTGHCNNPNEPVVKFRVLGGVARNGKPVILPELQSIPLLASDSDEFSLPKTPLILVTGSDMEVGKTTCAASLTAALQASGIRLAYVKLTGTGRIRDVLRVCYGRSEGRFDSSRQGWDFVDAGLASTAGVDVQIVRQHTRNLLRYAAGQGEIIIAELADGPTMDASLFVSTDPWIIDWLKENGLVMCACDTVSSTLIVQWLRSHLGLEGNHIVISGIIADDVSARREAEHISGVSVISCASPGGPDFLGGETAGGALADWALQNIMTRRKKNI
jgi:hypothetical protein